MKNAEKILYYLKENEKDQYCDDCLSVKLGIQPRQQINQNCNELLKLGSISRSKSQCSNCGKYKIANQYNEGSVVNKGAYKAPTKFHERISIIPDSHVDKAVIESVEELCRFLNINKIEIYNEKSLQHELNYIFREKLGSQYKTYLERNIEDFGVIKSHFTKKEMDISIVKQGSQQFSCIELKFPRKGQYPEQMFKVCEDLAFLEELKEVGFSNNYFIMFTDLPNFYSSSGGGHIYDLFRVKKKLYGNIRKPTGEKNIVISLKNEYEINWIKVKESLAYFVIKVG